MSLRRLKRRRRSARRVVIGAARRFAAHPDFDDLYLRAHRELSEATFEAVLAEGRRRAAARRHAILVRFLAALGES